MMTERSFHFVPGNRPDWFNTALSSGAQAVIFDLEDAVGEGEKRKALSNVASILEKVGGQHRPALYVRTNGSAHALFEPEVRMLARFEMVGFVIPKVHRDECVMAYSDLFDRKIIVLIESFNGLKELDSILEIAAIDAIGLGLEDMLSSDWATADELPGLISSMKTQIAIAARAHSKLPIDTVSLHLHDRDALREECEQARQSGLLAKFTIHPNQVHVVNHIFRPSEEHVDWAIMIVEASKSQASSGYTTVGGEIVSPAKIAKAKSILAANKASQ